MSHLAVVAVVCFGDDDAKSILLGAVRGEGDAITVNSYSPCFGEKKYRFSDPVRGLGRIMSLESASSLAVDGRMNVLLGFFSGTVAGFEDEDKDEDEGCSCFGCDADADDRVRMATG